MTDTPNNTQVNEAVVPQGSMADLRIASDIHLTTINPLIYQPKLWELEHKLAEI